MDAVSETLERPAFFRSGAEAGFRYANPTLIHFCLLRGARIVSALNASLNLAEAGYPQEIAVLLRTVLEYSSQIDFMLASRDDKGALSSDAATFLTGFFEDSRRTGETNRKAKLIQKRVHEIIGARLDGVIAPGNRDRPPAAELLSKIYAVFSNYVHGRYPESMDLYGGTPGRFHFAGMLGTPKDQENIEILDTLVTTVSNCFLGMVQDLDLRSLVQADPILRTWMQASLA